MKSKRRVIWRKIQKNRAHVFQLSLKKIKLEAKIRDQCEKHSSDIALILKENFRMRYTDDEWHLQNTAFCQHWLGMENWQQFKALLLCLWPYLKFSKTAIEDRVKIKTEIMELENIWWLARMRF